MDAPQDSRLKRLFPKLAAWRVPAWLRPWPIYLGAVAIVIIAVQMARHRAPHTADPLLPGTITLKPDIEVQFGDVIMEGREQGVKRWVITAPKVGLSRDGRYTYFDPHPKGRFFNLKDWSAQDNQQSDKMRSLVWQGDHAQYDSFTHDLAIDGHVIITTDVGDVIKTEHVDYNAIQKQVQLPKPVTVAMKDATDVKADTLKANTGAQVLEMQGHVDLLTNVNKENSK
ncbi:MAG TPA: LPS export ABC transporter periplasmic protein LptC [Oscillatoriaceae cyanobacterium]